MKKYLLFASVVLSFASCANDTFEGTDEQQQIAAGDLAISFGFDVPMPTRAEGAAAATALNNQIIVWGEKGETNGDAPVTDGSTAKQQVFPNYKVTYTANTAYTTTSNTKDWEYVGLSWASADAANVKWNATAVGTTEQTIKYWDYGASSYTFTAVSAKPADIASGAVKINKLTSGSTVYDKGYEVDITAAADLASLFFADRLNITSSSDKDRTAENQYGGNVKFTFRNSQSKVRVGMYETIPGYEVKVTKFYYADAANPAFAAMTTENTANFVANVPNTAGGVAGKYTVKYYDDTDATIENQPSVSFTPTSTADAKNYLELGAGVYNTTLATTSATPTYDNSGNYTAVMPQEANATNLKLKIDYQLSNSVTGETINIIGKTAEVPAKYLAWKPNYSYTYIFKITDDDLYPITFDAVVVEAADGTAEYITTVTEPSITTYAKGSAVTTNGEYAAGETVYATVMDGSALATLTASNLKLYTVTTTDATNFPITEASVAEAIAEAPIMTAAELAAAKIKVTDATATIGNVVIAEDGSTVTMGTNVVASFTTAASTVYAIQYIKTAATYGNDGGKTYADQTAFDAAGTLYTDAACTTVATTWADATTTYYKKAHVTNVGTYAYKIVRVQ